MAVRYGGNESGFMLSGGSGQYNPNAGALTGNAVTQIAGPGQTLGSSQGGTYFQDPALIQQLSSLLGGVGSQAAGQYMNFVANPTASPLYQNQLSGLLNALAPSEQLARTNLADTGRAAGMYSSGTFANAAARQEGDILRNRQTLASQLLGQMFPQMTQALQQPMSLAEQLINSLKLQQNSQQQSSQQFAPQTSGGGGGGTTGTKSGTASPASSGSTLRDLLSILGSGATTSAGSTPTETGQYNNVGQPSVDAYYNPISTYYQSGTGDPGSNIFLGLPEGSSVENVDFAPLD